MQMKDLPNPFWAFLFMVLGCVLLIAVLLKLSVNTTTVMLGVLMAVAVAERLREVSFDKPGD